MAGGWARDGAVQDQIDASINDELARLRQANAAREAARGQSLTHCENCDDPIPEPRRQAVPGVRLCVSCQQERDGQSRPRGG